MSKFGPRASLFAAAVSLAIGSGHLGMLFAGMMPALLESVIIWFVVTLILMFGGTELMSGGTNSENRAWRFYIMSVSLATALVPGLVISGILKSLIDTTWSIAIVGYTGITAPTAPIRFEHILATIMPLIAFQIYGHLRWGKSRRLRDVPKRDPIFKLILSPKDIGLPYSRSHAIAAIAAISIIASVGISSGALAGVAPEQLRDSDSDGVPDAEDDYPNLNGYDTKIIETNGTVTLQPGEYESIRFEFLEDSAAFEQECIVDIHVEGRAGIDWGLITLEQYQDYAEAPAKAPTEDKIRVDGDNVTLVEEAVFDYKDVTTQSTSEKLRWVEEGVLLIDYTEAATQPAATPVSVEYAFECRDKRILNNEN
jgi:hypothetical protein